MSIPMALHAKEAEHGIIGSLILDPTGFDLVRGLIEAPDFFDVEIGQLFAGLQMLYDAGKPANDPHFLLVELPKIGVPENVCKAAAISRFINSGLVSSTVFYAEQIAKAAALRRWMMVGGELLRRSQLPDADPKAIGEWCEAQLAMTNAPARHEMPTLEEIAFRTLQELREEAKQPVRRGFYTGLYALDDLKGPLLPGEMEILAARPGQGKTALGMQTAIHNAKQGWPTLFVSLEMKDRELVTRELCKLAKINSRDLRSGCLDATDFANLSEAASSTIGTPLRVYAPAAATVANIRGMARHAHALYGTKLVVVDYIGRIRAAKEQSRTPRHEIVQSFAEGLKTMAKELDVAVLSLCQLNRDGDEEPKLVHLRDSGAIEQEADSVVLLHHPDSSPSNAPSRTAYAIIAKHRHGLAAHVELRWHPTETRFSSQEPRRHSEFDEYNNSDDFG